MSNKSKIEWTDATWNPTRGCTKIAQGCKNCYASTFAERFRGVAGHPYQRGFDPRTAPDKLTEPLKWKKPRRIFVDSMSDLFHEAFSFEYISAVFGIMSACAERDLGHTFQILTKRPERAAKFFQWLDGARIDIQSILHEAVKAVLGYDHPRRPAVNLLRGWPLPNVHLGVSVENQPTADERVPQLLNLPAAVRFLSCEPLLGSIDLRRFVSWFWCDDCGWHGNNYGGTNDRVACPRCGTYPLDGRPSLPIRPFVDWVIAGGESGPNARPMHPDWARALRDQCQAAGVPFFFKQWGEWGPPNGNYGAPVVTFEDDAIESRRCLTQVFRVGKKAAGRTLDGREWNEFPEVTP